MVVQRLKALETLGSLEHLSAQDGRSIYVLELRVWAQEVVHLKACGEIPGMGGPWGN